MKKRKSMILLAIIIPVFLCIVWSFIEPHIIRVKNYEISHGNLPEDFSGLRIAFVSDLHIGKFTNPGTLDRIVSKLERENIDILLLGGDYVYHFKGDYNAIFQPFRTLGMENMIAVSGNHDNWEDYGSIINALKRNGFQVIDRSSLQIQRGDSLMEISGVPDLWDRNFSDSHLTKYKENYRILLSHNPDYLVNTAVDYDLGLSGHTHSGQITLFGLWAPYLPINNRKYWRGHYRLGEKDIIISRGIGTVIFPLRFCAAPEISIITLK